MRLLSICMSILAIICTAAGNATAQATDIHIPVGGNCFLTSTGVTEDNVAEDGIADWKDTGSVFTIYVWSENACTVKPGIDLSVPDGNSTILVRTDHESYSLQVSGTAFHTVFADGILQLQPGYNSIHLQGLYKTGKQFALVKQLVITTNAPDSNFHFVRENTGNRFYWGRRGPSVHLSYDTPKDKKITWLYTELTVPEGSDAEGSYFMANGFNEGYFGMQVNSPAERRVLFSVWSPFTTDDPAAIPADEKIVLLKKGKQVHTGEFGDEGSGGQSYLVYPWKAGNTYRFLVQATPDNKGATIYTAYFYAPEENIWRLIASFQRPKTSTHLTKLHSFLENFIDTNGFLSRRCLYGNQWAVDTDGKWHELTRALFTGDDIAKVQYRMDYAGGADSTVFYLKNGGFTNHTVQLKQYFTRKPTGNPPTIDFTQLP